MSKPNRTVSPLPPIAAWIRKTRERKGQSQADMARALDVHFTTVSKWERGVREPEDPSLFLLAEWAGVDGAVVMGGGRIVPAGLAGVLGVTS